MSAWGAAHIDPSDEPLLGMIGRSAALRRIIHEVETVAQTDVTVLIQGETGTGKELVARAIHLRSARPGAYVKLNCSAVPANLLESELMGHEKGAFTGAVARRIGRFEAAHDGTVFLDEIGEIPLEMQPKLLRLLQEREFERLGSNHTLRTNARLVAATNRDLQGMVAGRMFREDLFYRLSVFPLELPPLRERRDDIPDLARHFASAFASRLGKSVTEIPDDLMTRLCNYDWPGNVRQLQNFIERAVILAKDDVLQSEAIPVAGLATAIGRLPARPSMPTSPQRDPGAESDRLDDVQRRHILSILEATNWVIGGPHGAARRLGVKRPTLLYRMKKLGLERSCRDEFGS
jgi:formate hydrogenlyase transcriptional activator